MNLALRQYLIDDGWGAASRLALRLNVHVSDISDWARGKRPIPIHHAAPLEKFTKARVMRWDARPDDWHLHWPELRRRKAAPPVPETA